MVEPSDEVPEANPLELEWVTDFEPELATEVVLEEHELELVGC